MKWNVKVFPDGKIAVRGRVYSGRALTGVYLDLCADKEAFKKSLVAGHTALNARRPGKVVVASGTGIAKIGGNDDDNR